MLETLCILSLMAVPLGALALLVGKVVRKLWE